MSFAVALLVAAACGFTALSYEILWFRIYSFATGGSASSFGVLLGAYLAGIAFGSLVVWRWSRDHAGAHAGAHADADAREPDRGPDGRPGSRAPAALVVASNVAGFLLVPYVAWEVGLATFAFSLPAVAIASGLMGAVLPLVAHFGIAPDDRAGKRLSYLYLANIVGSATGSLLTGFVLMEYLPTGRISLVLLALGLALGALLWTGVRPAARAAALVAGIGLAAVAEPWLHGDLYERLLFKERMVEGTRFARLIENRSGVIAVRDDGAIFGGGMYDGFFNTDPTDNRNNVVRAYALAAFRERTPEVLMIGLASGSWAQVLASAPGVDRLTVVEINPGYVELIAEHPEVASILAGGKVEIAADDGRRWLLANPDRRFDAIVQNTTWYWRGHVTNLLSAEYMRIVKDHLKPGGVFYYNTNFGEDALKTGCSSFAHGFRLANFLALGDDPVTLDADRWRRALESWRIDGRPVFDLALPFHRERLDTILAARPEPCAAVLDRTRDAAVITDDNMAGEWSRPWWVMPASDMIQARPEVPRGPQGPAGEGEPTQ